MNANLVFPDREVLGLEDVSAADINNIIKQVKATESSEGDISWEKEMVYGAESVSINPDTLECDVHYSIEKFFGNRKDTDAPPAGKMRVKLLGMGTEVVFADGSQAKNDINSIFTSPYVKSKIEEFNNYII
jgi:hypothetical protein